MFSSLNNNHRPSLSVLNALYEYDDFMESIATLVDLGCGTGEDLVWWATRTTRDDNPSPLNIRCVGVDRLEHLQVAKNHVNITYQQTDFEDTIHPPKEKFDVLWCYDSFQYCLNPLQTLVKWRDIASPGAMLAITVPQTTNFSQKAHDIELSSGTFYHHSMVSLIYMLSVAGWDCQSGFFKKTPNEPWIHAVVYRSDNTPLDPRTTTWYDLVEQDRLFETANKSVLSHGYLRQRDLVVPWLDQSLTWMGKQ